MTTPSPTRYKLDVAPDAEQLARRCAERVASLIDLALDERDRAQIALSGGSTPAAAYRHLNAEHLPWNRVDVVLGDERWVPATDPASNARMLSETLLAAAGPGAGATTVRDRAVTIGAGKGLERITLTAPVLSAARHVIVLVSGAAKRQALQRLLDPAEPAERTPAKLVQPRTPVLVLADAAAAEGLAAPG